jgi:hypothetical protein
MDVEEEEEEEGEGEVEGEGEGEVGMEVETRVRVRPSPSPLLVPDPSPDPSHDPSGLASPGMAGAMQALALASPVGGMGTVGRCGSGSHRPPRSTMAAQLERAMGVGGPQPLAQPPADTKYVCVSLPRFRFANTEHVNTNTKYHFPPQ